MEKDGTTPSSKECQKYIDKTLKNDKSEQIINFQRWKNIVDVQNYSEGIIYRLRIKFNHGYQLSIVKVFEFLTFRSTEFELGLISPDGMLCSDIFPNATLEHVEKVLDYLDKHVPTETDNLKLIGTIND